MSLSLFSHHLSLAPPLLLLRALCLAYRSMSSDHLGRGGNMDSCEHPLITIKAGFEKGVHPFHPRLRSSHFARRLSIGVVSPLPYVPLWASYLLAFPRGSS